MLHCTVIFPIDIHANVVQKPTGYLRAMQYFDFGDFVVVL